MTRDEIKLIWQCADYWAQHKPEEEAVVFEQRRLTWRALRDQIESTAKAFLDLGIEKGDRVAFLGMARPEFLVTFLAAAKVGAIWLGLSPKFSVDELRYMLRNSEPKLLVSVREYQGRDLVKAGEQMIRETPSLQTALILGEPLEGARSFHEFVSRPRKNFDQPLQARAAAIEPRDSVLLMYTSGSTGHPKGVVHTHESILTSARIETEKLGLDASSRLLLHFPINHVAADVEIGLAGLYAGAPIVMMSRFDPKQSLALIARERITMVGQVPAMFMLQMQSSAFASTDFSHVKSFVWSGASAPKSLAETLNKLRRKHGARLYNGYGMTETAGFVTYSDDDDSVETLLTSAGKAPAPFELRIVDEQRKEIKSGAVGEIAVRGPILMKEYWRNPEATAEAFDEEGWFYTRDLAWKDSSGRIHIAGRKSEMFKSGGEKVFPQEIESVIETHPGVAAVAVVAVPDPVYTEVGRAFIVLKQGRTPDLDELRAYCRDHLANFKVPKHFEFRKHLPLLPNGKIDKRALRAETLKE